MLVTLFIEYLTDSWMDAVSNIFSGYDYNLASVEDTFASIAGSFVLFYMYIIFIYTYIPT